MIINNNKSNIETFGDIKQTKVSIDPKNLNIITTLLSSNLYSNPTKSFIREAVSNAWDSCVEAGTTNKPIILSIENSLDSNSYNITIRDYGTGISPERFKEIYCNIGSSTKRGSNDYIGGFGIGRFAALACNNIVKIISYYNGKAYYYVMVKDINNINITTLNIIDTDEDNGLEISVDIKSINLYLPSTIGQLYFIPNLYVNGSYLYNYSNDIKIKKFKYFSVVNRVPDNRLLLGNILYPIDTRKIGYDFFRLTDSGIVFNFNIGEIQLTPNRESIIYTDETIKLIKDRINLAYKELDELIVSKLKKNYDDICEYCNVIRTTRFYNPLLNEFSKKEGYEIYNLNNIIKLNNKFISNDDYIQIDNIFSSPIPKVLGEITKSCLYTSNLKWRVGNQINYKKILFIKESDFKCKYFRKFMCSNYENYYIAEKPTKEEFKESLKYRLNKISPELNNYVFNSIYDYYINKAKVIDFNTDKDYLSYCNSITKYKPSYIILYCYDLGSDCKQEKFTDLNSIEDFLSKKPTILHDSVSDSLLNISRASGYRYVKISKKYFKKLIKNNIKNLLTKDILIKIEKVRDIYSISKCILNDNTFTFKDDEFINIFNKSDLNKYLYIKNIIRSIKWNNINFNLNNLDIEINSKICSDYKYFTDLYNKYEDLIDKYNLYYKDSSELIRLIRVYLLDKLGIYKLNPDFKSKIKNNKIFKLLKDEKSN